MQDDANFTVASYAFAFFLVGIFIITPAEVSPRCENIHINYLKLHQSALLVKESYKTNESLIRTHQKTNKEGFIK